MTRDHQVLWSVSDGEATTACVMVSCCAGAELQVLRSTDAGGEQIVLRELFPTEIRSTSAPANCSSSWLRTQRPSLGALSLEP
jgi:hypothetical protein